MIDAFFITREYDGWERRVLWFATADIGEGMGAVGHGDTRDEAIANLVDFLIEEGRPLANSIDIFGLQGDLCFNHATRSSSSS